MNSQKPYDYKKNTELIRRAQQGDRAAMDELVSANMGLIRSIVPRFADRGAEYEDLVQIGAIGMIKAIGSFILTGSTDVLHILENTDLIIK